MPSRWRSTQKRRRALPVTAWGLTESNQMPVCLLLGAGVARDATGGKDDRRGHVARLDWPEQSLLAFSHFRVVACRVTESRVGRSRKHV